MAARNVKEEMDSRDNVGFIMKKKIVLITEVLNSLFQKCLLRVRWVLRRIVEVYSLKDCTDW